MLPQPPADLYAAFTMNGLIKVALHERTKKEVRADLVSKPTVWGRGWRVCPMWRWQHPPYRRESHQLYALLNRYTSAIKRKVGLVVGSREPWIECYLLHLGAARVVTLEYGRVGVQHAHLEAVTPAELSSRFFAGNVSFDFAVSFSSLEHSGLTRYGDAANPYGDLEAVAQIHCVTAPHALLFVGVPMHFNQDWLWWPMGRVYGRHRLPHFTANWNCSDAHPAKWLSFDANRTFVSLMRVPQATLVCRKFMA